MTHRRLLVLVCFLFLIMPVSSAMADFMSVTADLPIMFTSNEQVDSTSVSGAKVGISFVAFPIGFGVEQYTVTAEVGGGSADTSYSLLDVFYNLPIPIINIALGAGFGGASNDAEDATLTQVMASVGYGFLPFLDAHVGVHMVQSGETDSKIDYGGSMVSLGVKIGF